MGYDDYMSDYNEMAWDAFLAMSMLKDNDEDLGFKWKKQVPWLISGACSARVAVSFDGKVRVLCELVQSFDELKCKKFFTMGYRSELVAPIVKSLCNSGLKEEATDVLNAVASDDFVQGVLSVLGDLSSKCNNGGECIGGKSSRTDKCALMQHITPCFVRALKQYSWDFRSIEGELYEKVKKGWEDRLRFADGMKYDVSYGQFSLCVSVSKSFAFVNTRHESISASIITEEKPYLFGDKDYRLGWVIAPKVWDVVGMSPSDAATRARNHDGYFDLEALFGSYPWLDLCHSVCAAHADFLQMYPFDEFMERTNSFNEVVLRGDVEKLAIFVKREVCKDPGMVDKVNVLASVFSKDIVCYDEDSGTVTMLKQLAADTATMPEHLTNDTAGLLRQLTGKEVLLPRQISVRDSGLLKQIVENMTEILSELGDDT